MLLFSPSTMMHPILPLVLLAGNVLQSQALIEPSRNGTLSAKSYVDPSLSKDIASDEVDFLNPKDYVIPRGFFNELNEFEAALGLSPNSTHVDLRSGRIDLLTVSVPILPGEGIGNGLLWSVSPDADTHTGVLAPTNDREWSRHAIQAVNNWMSKYAAQLNINVHTELFAKDTVRTTVHSNGDMIQLHIPRMYKGIPVEGSRAMATIKLGNLINVGLEDWGSIPDDFDVLPTLTVEDAYDVLSRYVGLDRIRGGDHCNHELQILTMTPSSLNGLFGEGYQYKLAWRVCPTFENQNDVEAYEGLVDGHTGQIYSFVDRVHYFEAKGGVYPIANDGREPDGKEQSGWPMPFMDVGSSTTDTGGNYFVGGSVSASFTGPFVRVVDECGSSSLSGTNGLDWGTSGGTDCKTPGFGGKGNTHSSRTNFYELNKVIEIAKSHLPGNSWLKSKLESNVNINDSCNAWWLDTINFYRQSGDCGNTGELAGVIIHEWGHGLDDNDTNGKIAKPSGEGIADVYAALRMDDSCIGRGFWRSSGACTGVRQIDYKLKPSGKPKTYSNAIQNCNDRVHCTGSVYAEAVWSLYYRELNSFYGYDKNTALEIVTRLTYIAAGNVATWFGNGNSPPWGGCFSGSGYSEFLAADDDNGDIEDGTPHMQAIFKAFNDQEIACNKLEVKDSGCTGTPQYAPQVNVVPTDRGAIISWSDSGASNYQVFRTEGVKECNQGKVLLTTTSSLSFVDTGLMNGRKYFYIVIPKGNNVSCFGPSSSCIQVTPSEIPPPTTPSPTRKPSPPTKRPTKSPTKSPTNSPTKSPTKRPTNNPTKRPTKSPTNQPTQRCGNGICEMDEHFASCAVDCFNRQLNSIDDAPRGAPGIIFAISAKSRDINLSAFEFYTWEQSVNLVEIWTRPGLYSGFEVDQTGWQLVYSAERQLNGGDVLTKLLLSSKITVPSGSSRSFFIWINGGAYLKYKQGVFAGALADYDSYVNLFDGAGITGKFSSSYADVYIPRSFVGMISYDILTPPTTSPTMSPTNLPTNIPTMPPTNPPTNQPTVSTKSPTNRPTVDCNVLDQVDCVTTAGCRWRPYVAVCVRRVLSKTAKTPRA